MIQSNKHKKRSAKSIAPAEHLCIKKKENTGIKTGILRHFYVLLYTNSETFCFIHQKFSIVHLANFQYKTFSFGLVATFLFFYFQYFQQC